MFSIDNKRVQPSIIYQEAQRLVNAGISVVPIPTNGCKHPVIRWREYAERLPTATEITDWFFWGRNGLAVVCGSSGIEVLDFDSDGKPDRQRIQTAFYRAARRALPELFSGARRMPVVITPDCGMHLYYRTDQPEAGKGLAWLADGVLIETRGVGHIALHPCCPAGCHPSGRRYVLLGGCSIESAPLITANERQALHDVAASYSTIAPPAVREPRPPTVASNAGERVGDVYNRSGVAWSDILAPHGWQFMGFAYGDWELWRRPEKFSGCPSAVVYDDQWLRVYSTNGKPFETWTPASGVSYDRFAAFTLLNHSGDFTAATRALAARGYTMEAEADKRLQQYFNSKETE